jgi:ABC-type nickel/cobalt efflux system permease component RcnA
MNPEHITWLFLPSAVLLGMLHGLEPGHSKTMMVSLIIATRGTIAQAVLLGLSATELLSQFEARFISLATRAAASFTAWGTHP